MSLSIEVQARRGAFDIEASVSSSAASLGVVGPSGAGKTTLLLALAGLIPSRSLRLTVDGKPLVDTARGLAPPAHRRGVGYVFQDGRLFPHMTVAGNVGFASPYAADPMSVEAALALVDMAGFGPRWPASLSGGEARRVAIARALLPRPSLLLLDEPFAGLDAGRRDRLMDHLVRLRDDVKTPMILVSHNAEEVERLCTDVVTLEGGRRACPGQNPGSVER